MGSPLSVGARASESGLNFSNQTPSTTPGPAQSPSFSQAVKSLFLGDGTSDQFYVGSLAGDFKPGGTASAGSLSALARTDHVHPASPTVNMVSVSDHGAKGDGTTDDTFACQAAINLAGPIGANVLFPPGNYLMSSPLKWDTRALSVVSLAPSLTGAAGMSGPSRGSGYTMGVVQLTASSSFPVGEYMIDYLGPAPASSSAGNTGFQVTGFILQCNSRAAGIRSFNSENSNWSKIVINQPASPSPSFSSGNDLGAVNFCASPTYEAYQNRAERIFVYSAGKHGFNLQEGPGSMVYAVNCVSVNATQVGYCVGSYTNLIGCVEQGSVTPWQLKGSNINLANCVSQLEGSTTGNVFQVVASNLSSINIVGGFFPGANKSGLSGKTGAMMYFFGNGNTHVNMTGVTLRPGDGTASSPLLYVDTSATGSWTLNGCELMQGANYNGDTFSSIVTNQSPTTFTATFKNCPGINPVGSVVVSVPSSGTATAALPHDATFYVTANSSGSTSVTISNGPSITIPPSSCVPVLVPAGQTLTPAYSSAPTWVVEGL